MHRFFRNQPPYLKHLLCLFVLSACPRGAPFMMCLVNPCERVSCPANPKAKCRPDNCGRCTAQFFDDNNNLVNCSASKYYQLPHSNLHGQNKLVRRKLIGAIYARNCLHGTQTYIPMLNFMPIRSYVDEINIKV